MENRIFPSQIPYQPSIICYPLCRCIAIAPWPHGQPESNLQIHQSNPWFPLQNTPATRSVVGTLRCMAKVQLLLLCAVSRTGYRMNYATRPSLHPKRTSRTPSKNITTHREAPAAGSGGCPWPRWKEPACMALWMGLCSSFQPHHSRTKHANMAFELFSGMVTLTV